MTGTKSQVELKECGVAIFPLMARESWSTEKKRGEEREERKWKGGESEKNWREEKERAKEQVRKLTAVQVLVSAHSQVPASFLVLGSETNTYVFIMIFAMN